MTSGSGRGWRRGGRALLWLALAAAAVPAAGKELHWTGLEVEARLERDGTLAISELQRMVFTGDWNGGERSFRLFAGQTLSVERIARVDPSTGQERELIRGNLEEVDHWNWTSSNVLRWRSRLPGDPEFDGAAIDYRLVYRLSGALERLGERRYRLDHDFAFTDRVGAIEKVRVRLALAPEWRPVRPLPASWEGGPLPPGEGFVVPLEVELAPGVPAEVADHAVPARLPPPARWAALALFIAGVATFATRFVRRERALGRLGGTAEAPIDRAWLEANVFNLAPEVVGAAWDREVGSAEVAALLARLTAEGKLASEVKTEGGLFVRRSSLHLRLLVPRSALVDHERALVDALFGASDTTDTESVRRRYRSTGFDPAAKIRKGVEARVSRLRGFASGSPKPDWRPTGLLVAAGIAALALDFVLAPQGRGWTLAAGLGSLLVWVFFGLIPALVGRARVERLLGPALAILTSMALLGLGIYSLGGAVGSTWLRLGGALLLALGLARSAFNLFATRESAESLARRRELARARSYFRSELEKASPRLEDAWFPYLLAFGLAPKVDRWFRRFGSQATAGLVSPVSSAGSAGNSFGSRGSGAGGWSGGGGTFGGAGSTSSWALAATAMSAGVASPSSSGSGGGSGGGGSSGGGGGGGW